MAISVAPFVGSGIAHAETLDATGPGSFCENAPTENPFSDVSAADPALQEIICQAADEVGISVGFVDGTFRPNASTSRRQMALFMVRLADLMKALEAEAGSLNGLPEFDGENRFTDSEDEEAEVIEAINRLADAGIVLGTTPTTYNPGSDVTRRQMLLFITRLIEFVTGAELNEGDGADFPDQAAETAEVQEATNKLFEAGVVEGRADGTFGYAAPITRRQMTWFNMRTAELHFQLGLIESPFEPPAPTTNQSFAVSPQSTQLLQIVGEPGAHTSGGAGGQAVQYTVGGLTPGQTVNISLFPCGDSGMGGAVFSNGDRYPNRNGESNDGIFTFLDDFLNGYASERGYTQNGEALIQTVGFQSYGTQEVFGIVVPADGQLGFRVGVDNNSYGDCAVPVVWRDVNNDGDLNLATPLNTVNAPAEPVGVGGAAVFHFGEAPNGYDMEDDVVFVNIAQKFWVDEEGYQMFWGRPGDTYWYDAHNFGQISQDLWEQFLSIGDNTSDDPGGQYSRTGGATFENEGDTPGTPRNVALTVGDFDAGGTANDIRVGWDYPMPLEGNISEFYVELYNADTLAFVDWEETPYQPNLAATGPPTQVTFNNLPNGNYVAVVWAYASDYGNPSLLSAPATVGTPAQQALITDQRVTTDTVVVGLLDTGDVVQIRFDRTMANVTTNQAFFRWSDGDSVYQVACTDQAACVWSNPTASTSQLQLTLTAAPQLISGTGNGLDITGAGAEMVLVSNAVLTADGAIVNLADSPDKQLNIAPAL